MFTVTFYETRAGGSPVKDWIRSLDVDDQKTVGKDLLKVQFGFPLGPPLCKHVGNGLWQVRSTLKRGVEARVLFFHHSGSGSIVALHGFIKKARKAPKEALDLARQRMREFDP